MVFQDTIEGVPGYTMGCSTIHYRVFQDTLKGVPGVQGVPLSNRCSEILKSKCLFLERGSEWIRNHKYEIRSFIIVDLFFTSSKECNFSSISVLQCIPL